jgi:hypothetical protein
MKKHSCSKQSRQKDVNITPEIESKFWSLTGKTSPASCWLFQSRQQKYPRLHLGKSTYYSAHRVSLAIKNGVFLSKEVFACHTCDNPSCVNPNHLFAGDAALNMKDKCAKGRQAKGDKINKNRSIPKGEMVKTSKLKTADVEQIRKINPRGDKAQQALGKQYGVSARMIRYILKREWWAAA